MTLSRYRNQLPDIFEKFFGDDMDLWSKRNYSSTNTTIPAVNIKENDKGFVVELAAPGLKKEDFHIELDDNVLKVYSEKEEESEVKEGEEVLKKEFSYQSFVRSFTLPETIDKNKIKASYKDGILKVDIPKKDVSKPKSKKQIKIS